MKCIYCGANNPEDAKFCHKCGEKLLIDISDQSSAPPKETDTQRRESEEKKVMPDSSPNTFFNQAEDTNDQDKPPDSKKEESTFGNSQQESTASELMKEIIDEVSKKPLEVLREIDKEPIQKNDVECPFCHSKNCQPMQKNRTTVTKSGYSLSNGCCGMCLLGPFGLLCGLCGTSSKVDVKNESWWTCMDCGKEHISQKSAIEKFEAMIVTLFGIALFGGVLLSLAIWSFGVSFISLVLVCMAFGMPYGGWCAALEMSSEELGYPITEILPIEKKRTYFYQFIGCMVIVVLGGLLFIPVLSSMAGE